MPSFEFKCLAGTLKWLLLVISGCFLYQNHTWFFVAMVVFVAHVNYCYAIPLSFFSPPEAPNQSLWVSVISVRLASTCVALSVKLIIFQHSENKRPVLLEGFAPVAQRRPH